MSRASFVSLLLVASTLTAASASAQSVPSRLAPVATAESAGPPPEGRPAWSVVSAETVGAGANVLQFQVGYPGISATYLAGQTERFDAGGRFTFLYGSEASTAIAPGLRLQGILRFLVGSKGRVRFGLEFEPGIQTYFYRFGGATFGVALPVKFTVGIPVLRQLALHVGIDMPLMFTFVPGFTVAIPVLLGGGVEYLVTEDISLNFRMRFGPSIIVAPGAAGVTLGLDVLLGVAIRL